MGLGRPKSFVAGVILLMWAVGRIFTLPRPHIGSLPPLNLALSAAASALCFWHAFKGKKPLLAQTEQNSSLWLGTLALLVALGGIGGFALRHGRGPFNVLTTVVFFVAAVFYFWQALQERRASTGQDSPAT